MLDPVLAERVTADYQTRRTELAVRLDVLLAAATDPAQATRAAAKSLKARCKTARTAIGEALESPRGAVANATDLAMLFDRLVAGETAACINAVAMVAARWDDPAATMERTHAAVIRAYENGREDAVRHLADDASESKERLRPLPIRLVRGAIGTLVGGGLLWRGGLWVTQHWPEIAAHLHH